MKVVYQEEEEKAILTEALDINGVNSGNELETLVPEIMNTISQIHIWHLLCPSGQKHTALGELYDNLQNEVDELAEIYIGMGGTLSARGMKPFIADMTYSDNKVVSYLKEFTALVNTCLKNTSNKPEMFSLQDELGDIQETIYHFIYKFDMN